LVGESPTNRCEGLGGWSWKVTDLAASDVNGDGVGVIGVVPLKGGQSAEVLLQREADAPAGTARLVVTCRSRWRTWQVLRSVRLEGPPPEFQIAVV
jgi:hypothetical protein